MPKRSAGFTLIELLLVLAIGATLTVQVLEVFEATLEQVRAARRGAALTSAAKREFCRSILTAKR